VSDELIYGLQLFPARRASGNDNSGRPCSILKGLDHSSAPKQRLSECSAVRFTECEFCCRHPAVCFHPRCTSEKRRLDDAEFVRAYQETKRAVLHHGITKLTAKVSLAVDVLEQVAKQKGKPHQGARAAAAGLIVKLALDAAMVEDIEMRLERLERHHTDDE
jgi:hypothetical protein